MTIFTSSRWLLTAGSLLTVAPSFAQAPTLTTITPGRHAANAPRTTGVTLTFSQPVSGASTVRVHSSQWRGYRAAAGSGEGTTTLRVQPVQAFAPGELVSVTVPGTVQNGSGVALAGGSQVVQFRAAAGPASATFSGSTDYTEPSAAIYTPRLADVNNDGRLDFLLVEGLSNRVELRLGDGRGNLSAPSNLALGQDPREIQLADFNNDGNLDLVVATQGVTRFLSVALGSGTGSFSVSAPVPAATLPMGLQVGDVNGDGNQDLVCAEVAPATSNGGTASANLAVHLGDGQGNFTAQPLFALPAGTSTTYLHDLNNDGKLDCVVGNATTGLLTTYLGRGTGAFVPATGTALSVGTAAGRLTLAELTGDGVLDVAVADNTAGTIRVHPGDGQGSFGAAAQTLTLPGAYQTWTADLNGDGTLDLLATTRSGAFLSGNVFGLFSTGTGSFQAAQQLTTGASSLATGDLNNDGTLDLALMDVGISGATPAVKPRLNQPLPAAPTITNFTPTSASTGAVVTVNGTNFTGATAVLVGGVPASFAVNGANSLQFFVPAGLPSSALITVITPSGTATSFVGFSLVLAAHAGAGTLPVSVFPNPAHGQLYAQLRSAGPVQLELFNQLGQLVHRRTVPTAGTAPLTVDLAGVAPGLYTLRIGSGGRVTTQRVVVE